MYVSRVLLSFQLTGYTYFHEPHPCNYSQVDFFCAYPTYKVSLIKSCDGRFIWNRIWYLVSLMSFDEFWWVLMSFDGFWWVLMGFAEFCWVLMGFDEFWWVLMNFDEVWWVLMVFAEICWVLLSFDGFCWVLISSVGFWWVLMGFDEFWWILMNFQKKSSKVKLYRSSYKVLRLVLFIKQNMRLVECWCVLMSLMAFDVF